MLKPQDVLIVLKLVALGDRKLSQYLLGRELGMSASEINNGIERAKLAGLLSQKGIPNKIRILEFLKQGLPSIYPAKEGALTRGMATSYAAPPLNQVIVSTEEDVGPVWPHPMGDRRGFELQPLYRSAPDAAMKDTELYELLTLVDALRTGRARERKLAADFLESKLKRLVMDETEPVRVYRFDLKRAAEAPNCQYFMRLAQSVNDLLSIQQLLDVDKSAMSSQVQDGLKIYLLRLHASHLVEAFIAFVEKAPHKGVIDFIEVRESLDTLFVQLQKTSKDKRFKNLRRLRNSFSFHYDYEQHGKDTMDALRAVLESEDDDVGLVIRPTSDLPSSHLYSRNVFADHIVLEGWLRLADVRDEGDESITNMQDHIKFLGEATSKFIEFAERAFLEWIQANNLQVRGE